MPTLIRERNYIVADVLIGLGLSWECEQKLLNKEKWERKEQWHKDNGYFNQLVTSEDGLDGSIDAAEIERIARKKILMEG